MKHAIIGIESRKVYRVKEIKLDKDDKEIIPGTSDHKEVIEITNAEAEAITGGDPKEVWHINPDGKPEDREATRARRIAARPPTLTSARSGMSQLIASMPVESRAKFAEARAGVEKLLDLGDLEAAHHKLGTITTDTDVEATVKATLLAALAQFL